MGGAAERSGYGSNEGSGAGASTSLFTLGTHTVLKVKSDGPPGTAAPDTVISLDAATVAAVGAGRRTIGEPAADGAITIDGDPNAAAALIAAFESVG